MSEHETELAIEGLSGSPGIAFGRILRLGPVEPQAAAMAARGANARAALQAAVDRARRELAALIARSGGLAASIFEFQAALLEDGDLLEPIYVAAVEAGPAPAWTRALDGEIAAYRGSADEALAGRAADLEDLKLRVLAALAGRAEERPRADVDGAILVADEFTPSRFFAAQDRLAVMRGTLAGAERLARPLGSAFERFVPTANDERQFLLHTVQNIQPAPPARPLQVVAGVGDMLQLFQHKAGNIERPSEKPRSAHVCDSPVNK